MVVFALGFWALQRAQLGGDPNDPAKVLPRLGCVRMVAWQLMELKILLVQ